MKKVMSESTYDNKLRPGHYQNNYANMAAALIVETEGWGNWPPGFSRLRIRKRIPPRIGTPRWVIVAMERCRDQQLPQERQSLPPRPTVRYSSQGRNYSALHTQVGLAVNSGSAETENSLRDLKRILHLKPQQLRHWISRSGSHGTCSFGERGSCEGD